MRFSTQTLLTRIILTAGLVSGIFIVNATSLFPRSLMHSSTKASRTISNSPSQLTAPKHNQLTRLKVKHISLSQEMKDFKFENYKTGAAVQQQLTEWFPPGTNLLQFIHWFQSSGGKCHRISLPIEVEQFAICSYHLQEPKSGYPSSWHIRLDYDKELKITNLRLSSNQEADTYGIEREIDPTKLVRQYRKEVRRFKFKDYIGFSGASNEEIAARAKERLVTIFPLGSDVKEFLSMMLDMNRWMPGKPSECSANTPDEQGVTEVICHHTGPAFLFVSPEWIVSVKFDAASHQIIAIKGVAVH